MTDHADRPTPRVAFYGRTNQLSQNGDRDIARQYRMCLAILPGPLIGFYYDTGIDVGGAHARAPAGRDAGGPPRWDGGNEELTARLNSPDADLDAVLHDTLRGLLLDRPNLLSAGWTDYCVQAGLAAIIPRWWEPPPPTARCAGVASGNG